MTMYHARKEDRLATGGPYAFVRHPQYTGIFLGIFGEGVVHWPTVFSLSAFPIIVIVYVLLARKEERQMLEKFGERYREYQERVPMFFPRWRDWPDILGSYQHRTSPARWPARLSQRQDRRAGLSRRRIAESGTFASITRSSRRKS